MADTTEVRKALAEATPEEWEPYFNSHGDPFVVPAAQEFVGRALMHRIADVSTAPKDYGRANAMLLGNAKAWLAQLCDDLDTAEAALATTIEQRDQAEHQAAAAEAALAESRGEVERLEDALAKAKKHRDTYQVSLVERTAEAQRLNLEVESLGADLGYLKSIFEGNVAYPQNGPLASAVRRLTDHLGGSP